MDNCLTYALRMARYGRAGDHLVIRKSHWGWFPHFSVMIELDNGDLLKKEYVPIGPRSLLLPLVVKASSVMVSSNNQVLSC